MRSRPLVAVVLCLLAPLLARAEAGHVFTVALDPGHGGLHDGAISPHGVREKDVVLAIGKRLRELLLADGDVRVVMTRTGDQHVPLHERTALANAAGADLLVSIHCNSMPTKASRRTARGVETYFLSADATDADAHALADRENADVGPDAQARAPLDPIELILQDLSRSQAHADSSLLALMLHSSLVRTLEPKDRGVRQAPFLVLVGAEMPAALAEVGFISHPDEGKSLAEAAHQDEIARALRDGIRRFQDSVHARRARPASARLSP